MDSPIIQAMLQKIPSQRPSSPKNQEAEMKGLELESLPMWMLDLLEKELETDRKQNKV